MTSSFFTRAVALEHDAGVVVAGPTLPVERAVDPLQHSLERDLAAADRGASLRPARPRVACHL